MFVCSQENSRKALNLLGCVVQSVAHPVLRDIKFPNAHNPNRRNDGWLRGSRGELILWVPHSIAKNIQPLDHRVTNGYPSLSLDFSEFSCGEKWAEGRSAAGV